MKGKIRYQKELQKTYMIVTECDRTLIENYAGRMVLQGRLKGLAECRKHYIDGNWEIWYDISSLQPLNQVFAVKEMAFSELKCFVQQLLALLEELEKCLMDSGQICLDPALLFWDMEREQVKFLFDYTERKTGCEINKLAEFLLERTCHEDEKAVNLVYFFYELVQKENFSVKDVEVYLHENPEEIKSSIQETEIDLPQFERKEPETILNLTKTQPEQQTAKRRYPINWNSREGMLLEGGLICTILVVLSTIGFFIAQRYFVLTGMEKLLWIGLSMLLFVAGIGLAVMSLMKEWKPEKRQAQIQPEVEGTIFEESDFYTRVLEEQKSEEAGGKTLYVGNALLNREYYLIEKGKDGEKKHIISSYPFLIGKEKERVNLIIKNHSVSRIHARLIEEDGMVYVEDLHSTNGTYLNDFLLTPHERMRLKRGDFLQFGKVEFDFR